MASLEAVGPSLTTHCVASWLVGQSVPPDFITTMPSDPADAQESGEGQNLVELQKNVHVYRPIGVAVCTLSESV